MTYAKNYRDGKWYQASIVTRLPWGVAVVQFHEGPERDARDYVLTESVQEHVFPGGSDERAIREANRAVDRVSA